MPLKYLLFMAADNFFGVRIYPFNLRDILNLWMVIPFRLMIFTSLIPTLVLQLMSGCLYALLRCACIAAGHNV